MWHGIFCLLRDVNGTVYPYDVDNISEAINAVDDTMTTPTFAKRLGPLISQQSSNKRFNET